MSLLVPPRRFDPAQPELMDRPGHPLAILRGNLRVLARINRCTRAYAISLYHLRQLLRLRSDARAPLTILDLATGGADVPRVIAAWARRRGLRVAITATDNNPDIVALAREFSAGYPEIRIEHANLLADNFAAGSYDVVLNSLALHHLTDAQAVEVLRRMAAIARVGFILNDLRRGRVTIAFSRLLARTVLRNPLARHDAPASCAAAFTPAELRTFAERAELKHYAIWRHPGARMALRAWHNHE